MFYKMTDYNTLPTKNVITSQITVTIKYHKHTNIFKIRSARCKVQETPYYIYNYNKIVIRLIEVIFGLQGIKLSNS